MNQIDELSRHEYVLKMMLSGQPVNVEDIKEDFIKRGCENVFYKLSYYILLCKQRGAIIKTIKDGRKVKAYQLMNPNQFDSKCKFIKPGTVANVKEKEYAA
jgi:hypothetical protein